VSAAKSTGSQSPGPFPSFEELAAQQGIEPVRDFVELKTAWLCIDAASVFTLDGVLYFLRGIK